MLYIDMIRDFIVMIPEFIAANRAMIFAAFVVIFGACGTYLMLPHKHGLARPRSVFGAGVVAASLGLLGFVTFWSPPGPFLATVFLYIFGLFAIVGGLLTVTSRNPVYSALWFASVVLSTAGLFLLADAPFLAAGTIIVYAGAIIVTFLFVIMLAQMEGKADYDRAARSPAWATFTCFLILWCLMYSVATVRQEPTVDERTPHGRLAHEKNLLRSRDRVAYEGLKADSKIVEVIDSSLPKTSQISEAGVPTAQVRADGRSVGPEAQRVFKPHVAGLGASLYTDHLVTVGIAGALLFVALIGAVAITNPRRPIRPGTDPAQAAALGTSRP
jgi:NADH-quinone oxidoreductase subunit J